MLKLASLVTLLALAVPVMPTVAYAQRGTPAPTPRKEQPKAPPGKAPDRKSTPPEKDGDRDKDAPDRRDRMKQRDKEMDRILNRKR